MSTKKPAPHDDEKTVVTHVVKPSKPHPAAQWTCATCGHTSTGSVCPVDGTQR